MAQLTVVERLDKLLVSSESSIVLQTTCYPIQYIAINNSNKLKLTYPSRPLEILPWYPGLLKFVQVRYPLDTVAHYKDWPGGREY